MFRFTRYFLILIMVATALHISANRAQAQLFTTPATQALLLDADTGTILFSKEIDKQIPPASLAKLMTMEVVFHQLKTGALRLDRKFFVSENAWRTGGANSGGSTMFAKLNSEIELENLIKGVIVQSANDGCIIIAEGLAGTEATFAALMNERAREIGLTNSNFVNSTGLPAEGQYVTVADLATLARHMVNTYPEYLPYYKMAEFEWNGINQRNRNPLLKMDIGADGFKTGYTEASGYGIVGTAIQDGQRLIAVMSGMKSKRQRLEESRKILDWGFNAFEKLPLFADQEIIGQAYVYGGEKSGVDVVGRGPVEIYVPIGNRDRLKARIVYTGPLMPPVAKGDRIATLKVWIGDELSQKTDLYAAETVEQGGIRRQAADALWELLLGWI